MNLCQHRCGMNHQTRLVKHSIISQISSLVYWKREAERQLDAAHQLFTVRAGQSLPDDIAVPQLAAQLESHITGTVSPNADAVFRNLMTAALRDVDWRQIADALLEYVDPMPCGIPDDGTRFPTGIIVVTPRASAAIPVLERSAALGRHERGDWGEILPEQSAINEDALLTGAGLLSAYRSTQGIRCFVITLADWSVTTVLLADEY